MLQRTKNASRKVIYRIDQRWVKKNRDLENIVFGVALQEHDKFILDASFLLSMAFAEKVLFGFGTLADFRNSRFPEVKTSLSYAGESQPSMNQYYANVRGQEV